MIRLICYTQRINFTRRQHVLLFDVSFLENPCEYPHKLYIARKKLEPLPKIITANSMCLCLLVFTQLFSEFALSQPAKPARKQNLMRNSLQSRSFKVMHFGITEKPTTDCISLYNNTGLISKVSEKIASENAENCRSRQPQCRLMPPPRGIPRIFA